MAILTRLLPFLAWFKDYSTGALRSDLISGLTVALVLIPQSMAYAQLAGLPAYYGLYAAFLPPMIGSLFGSSRQLATGPVAVVSLMTAAALEPLATAGSAEYVQYAVLLALLVGVFQLSLGLLRLGLIINFLSHPVVNGFTNAAALIIATSQLSKLFGVYVDKAEHHYETTYRVLVAALRYTHWPTLCMAILAFAVMYGLRRVDRRIPNVLVAVALTTLISWAIGFEKNDTVDISRIESPEARSHITTFNSAVTEKTEMEEFRVARNKAIAERSEVDLASNQICSSCHARRGLAERQIPDSEVPSSDTGKALVLHHLAGLLDIHIEQLKEEIGEHRAAIQRLHFEATEDADGRHSFFALGELPAGAKAVGGRWRIKIGEKPLDQNSLTMIGGGAIVSTIPAGLPKLALPEIDWAVAARLFIMAMIISLIGFMEAISIAKAMSARTQQWLDPNQELVGQGLANMVGCLGQSYAVSGSFSRSAVNLQAGAVTGFSNVCSSAVVVLVLLFATSTLYYLPQAVLAAVIMMAVFGLLNVQGFVHAWRAQRFDGITAVLTFFFTLLFAPHLEWGIAIGVALSLGRYLYRTTKPHVADLALHPDGSLRDATRHGFKRCRHIAAIRFDGPLNFANTSYLEDRVLERIAHLPELRHVFIAAHGINEIDASGEEMLGRLTNRLREAGYEVSLSGLNDNVLDVLRRTGLYEAIGEDSMAPTQALAIQQIYAKAHAGSSEEVCPLIEVVPVDVTTSEPEPMSEKGKKGQKGTEKETEYASRS
jgi:MFS superfamily sulfate permease-like transporter